MYLNLTGWIIYVAACCAYLVCVYALAWSHVTASKHAKRTLIREAERANRTDSELVANLVWRAFRKQEYQAAMRRVIERAQNTHPERVAEMFSVRVTDTATLKEVV